MVNITYKIHRGQTQGTGNGFNSTGKHGVIIIVAIWEKSGEKPVLPAVMVVMAAPTYTPRWNGCLRAEEAHTKI